MLAVGAGGGCLDIFFSRLCSLFFLPLWETAQCRLKYHLRGPLSPNQPTNQPNINSVLQVRRGKRDNLGIISHFFHKDLFCDPPLELSH